MLKRLLATSLLSATLCLPIPAAIASPVKTISTTQAQGKTSSLPTILVWSGSGTNLNFLPTGEQIQRVWLDDPSRITLDFDAPLCQGRDGRACSRSTAAIIHLKRINAVNWAGLPKSNTTLLTVVTDGARGRQLYQFRVAYGSGTPQYSTVEIQPNAIAASSRLPLGNLRSKPLGLQNVERGLQTAIRRRLVKPQAPIVSRIRRFLVLSRSGVEVPLAAQKAGVSLALVNKLAYLGL